MLRFHLSALSLLLAGSVSAQESYSAKSLFFGEDNSVVAVSTAQKEKTPPTPAVNQDGTKKAPVQIAKKKSTPQNIGVSYFVRLKNPDGSSRDVLASRKFKSGERFQLGIKVNHPSYVYVLNEAPNGKTTQIYPQPGVDNFINAMGTVFLPSKGAFEFDQEPGTEQLLVYVSTSPMTQISDYIKQASPDVITAIATPVASAANCIQPATVAIPNNGAQLASAETYASKGISFTENTTACAQETQKPESSYASKGISFTDDNGADTLQSASYVVKKTTAPDANLFLKIKLNHQ